MTLPGAWSGLPDLHNLAVNTERNGQRHWTECTQSSCIMAVHNWRPEVPVTNAERDALDATPPHQPLTGTTVRERDACLLARYGWAGARANGYAHLWGLLAAGWVGVFAGSGVWPGVTDFTGNHALAIGPVAGTKAWVRDPLHPVGHWADIAEIEAWSWDAVNVALYPPNDPNMIADLLPILGIQMTSPGTTVDGAYATVPPVAPVEVVPAVAAVSAPGSEAQAVSEVNWGLVGLALGAVALAYLATRKVAEQ